MHNSYLNSVYGPIFVLYPHDGSIRCPGCQFQGRNHRRFHGQRVIANNTKVLGYILENSLPCMAYLELLSMNRSQCARHLQAWGYVIPGLG
jgi:hypothetical protein